MKMNVTPVGDESLAFSQISIIVRQLGIYRNYKGYKRLIYAIYLVLENENRLEAVVKEVYMPVAEKYRCSWGAVERCLRESINRIWITNHEKLCEVANADLTKPPTPAELIDIIAVYINTKT